MAYELQAASAGKLADVTLWREIIKKRKRSVESCYMAGRGGVLQANSVLTDHSTILIKPSHIDTPDFLR